MNGFKVWILFMCITFTIIPGVQAQPRWQLKSISDVNIAFCRKADNSGLSVYLVGSGAVWLCVKLPHGTQDADLSRPVEVRVDQSQAFFSSQDALQPDPAAIAWEISAPGNVAMEGSLLDRLMKGRLIHVYCYVAGGHRVKVTLPLNGSREVIERLLPVVSRSTTIHSPSPVSPHVYRMPRAGTIK